MILGKYMCKNSLFSGYTVITMGGISVNVLGWKWNVKNGKSFSENTGAASGSSDYPSFNRT
jgi:hypothetical protein